VRSYELLVQTTTNDVKEDEKRLEEAKFRYGAQSAEAQREQQKLDEDRKRLENYELALRDARALAERARAFAASIGA